MDGGGVTQEDPIGVAGGVNLYGFGGGDPVNHMDPFGLDCQDKDGNKVPCQVSDAGVKFIAGFEGFRSAQYTDAAGYATIGYGHRILEGESFDRPLSPDEGLALLKQDLSDRVQSGLDAVKVNLSQTQVDALGSFIFNVGAGAFGRSTLLSQLNKGSYSTVPDQLARWNRAGGRVLSDLTARRKAEGNLWSSGTYQ